jgi:hypothetical protein
MDTYYGSSCAWQGSSCPHVGRGHLSRQQTQEECVSAKTPQGHTQQSVVGNEAYGCALHEEHASVDSHKALPTQDCHLGGCGA